MVGADGVDGVDGLRRRGVAATDGEAPLGAATAAPAAADGNAATPNTAAVIADNGLVDADGQASSGTVPPLAPLAEAAKLPAPLRFPPSTARRFGENPFIRRDRPPCLRQYVKYTVGVVIAPIRLFLVAFTLCFGLSVGLTCLAGVSDASLQQRLKPKVRQLIYYLIRIFSRVILFIVGLYKIEEHRLADEAAELAELNGAPFLLVSNHVSFLDIPYHFARDAVAFVAKVEVRRLPIIGRIAAVAQCIFTSRAYVPPSLGGSPVETRSSPREVGRPAAASPAAEGGGSGSPARARLSSDDGGEHMEGASAKIGSRLQQPGFPTILLFPEGTTSNNCALLRFRTGAFIHGAPVKPVVLQWGVYDVDPAYVKISKTALLRLLCEPRLYLRVTRMPLYRPSAAEKADPRLFAENVRRLMARQLRVPLVPFSLADRRRRQMSSERANYDELDLPAASK
ncbi:hypothetical protein MMPV_005874 [Pyropia vietnamensis]